MLSSGRGIQINILPSKTIIILIITASIISVIINLPLLVYVGGTVLLTFWWKQLQEQGGGQTETEIAWLIFYSFSLGRLGGTQPYEAPGSGRFDESHNVDIFAPSLQLLLLSVLGSGLGFLAGLATIWLVVVASE